jgi:hypothetical protein
MRRRVEYGGDRSAQTRAVLGRLEDEREIRQQREGRRGDDPALGALARALPRVPQGRASARGGDAQGRAGVLACQTLWRSCPRWRRAAKR